MLHVKQSNDVLYIKQAFDSIACYYATVNHYVESTVILNKCILRNFPRLRISLISYITYIGFVFDIEQYKNLKIMLSIIKLCMY
jgi:hypothetical protein